MSGPVDTRGPVRMCVACRRRQPAQRMLRYGRRRDGVVVPALARRTQGRSAYVCPDATCLKRAVVRRGLSRSLATGSGRGCRVVHPPELSGLRSVTEEALQRELSRHPVGRHHDSRRALFESLLAGRVA